VHKLGVGIADRTSTDAEGSSVHYLFWRLSWKRTWTRCGSKRDLDESWVLTIERLSFTIVAWQINQSLKSKHIV